MVLLVLAALFVGLGHYWRREHPEYGARLLDR